jgi:lysozyme family protein
MQENFNPSLVRVLVYEGGYANNPKDPGGATMKGITQGTYNSWRARHGLPTSPVKGIGDDDVSAIYKADYWDRMDCDEMAAGVDFCLFDAAVNSGVGGATTWAEGVCGLDPDGDFGPKIKAAILAMDPETFIREFNSRRLGTLQRLPTWKTFGHGWAARISNGEKIELDWAQAGDGPDPVDVSTIGGSAKARPSDVPQSKSGAVITHMTTVGGAVATGAAQAGQSLAPASDTFTWLKFILGGLTILGALAGLIVYFAQQTNAAASNATRKATVDPDADADVPSVQVARLNVVPPPNPGVTLVSKPAGPTPTTGGVHG